MAATAGYNAKIRLNGQNFSGAEWSVEDQVVDIPVTNTEGKTGNSVGTGSPGYESHIAGPRMSRVTIKQASFDPSENPFIAPMSVNVGSYTSIQIYPGGTTGRSINLSGVLITRSSYNGRADRDQPLSLEGVTDGVFTDLTS